MNLLNVAGCALLLMLAVDPGFSGPLSSAYYVSPSGSDSNPGTAAQPFHTLAHAQAQMEVSGHSKFVYLRAGTYSSTALTLTAADDGQTWSYYPADGYDSAILDAGASSATTGGNAITIDGGSNITIDGLTIRNCRAWCIGVHGGAADPVAGYSSTTPPADHVTITNNVIHDSYNVGTWTGAGVWISTHVTDLTLSNNSIYNCQGFCFAGYAHYTWRSGDRPDDHTLGNFSGLVVRNNVVFQACIATSDCGAIYVQDETTQFGPGSNPITIKNNFIRDYQSNGATTPSDLSRAVAIYLDMGTSNCAVTGNVIANTSNVPGTPTGPSGSTTAFWVNAGRNNTFSGNIIDLGTTARIADGGFGTAPAPNPTFAMTGNTVSGNILIGSWSGTQQAALLGGAGNGWFFTSDSTPATPLISNNLYYNYGSGSLSTTANIGHSDSSPITTTDPSFNTENFLYQLNSGSRAFAGPLNFPGIAGGWGPPGYSIPAGTPPSYPLRCCHAGTAP